MPYHLGVRRLFLLLYAASGAAALVYEVVWTRLLTLRMGHTSAAASTVLAALMGGLAVGAWAAGSRRRAPAAHLRMYAALEIGVAACALLLPFALVGTEPLLAAAYADGDASIRFAIVRLTISLVLVGIPAAAMGATFPVAAGWYAGTAADAGVLYAANTAGAAAGAIAAGFWLIPAIGLRGATIAGAALNGAAAAGALWIASRGSAVAAAASDEPRETRKPITPSKANARRSERSRRTATASAAATLERIALQPRVAMTAAAISGFVALVYEVAWTRLVALVIGPTTYAFAIVVASVVVGLAIGSSLGARLARRSTATLAWLAAMLAATAAAASAAAWFAASRLPLIVAAQVSDPAAAFGPIVVRQAVGVALLLLPMSCALGAVFSLAVAAASTDRDAIGRDAARVYAWNTAGAIAGSLTGGFVLLPIAGLQNEFRAAASIGLAAAAGVIVVASGAYARRQARAAAAALVLAAAGAAWSLLPPWDLDLLASGAYKYAPYLRQGAFESEVRSWRLAYYRDGAAATVSVRELAGMRSLVIDGKVDASNMGDMLTQRLLGILPVLLHPHPDDVCVIGLGSGVTLGSALASGAVRRADVVEISPDVVEASGFFARENRGALTAPGVHLIVGDGRSHLLLTDRRYDVIVSEPSNPWMAGIASLFTREFFEGAKARLKPDGIFCQWAHTYDISDGDLRSIARTFNASFPQSTMWLVGEGDLLLIGTNGAAIAPHLDGVAARWRAGTIPALLDELGISDRAASFALFSMLVGGPADLARYGEGAPMQTDDRMALEFSAPRAIYGASTGDNAAALRALAAGGAASGAARAALDEATDASWTVAGTMQLKADAFGLAYDAFARAVRLDSRNADALAGLSDAATGARRLDEERAWLQSLAASEPGNAAVRIELSRILAASGDVEHAIPAAQEAMRIAPGDPRTAEQLASVLADAGDGAKLAPLADALVARFPDRDKPRYYRANARFLTGRAEEAIVEAQAIVAANPRDVRAQNLLGVACASVGRRPCAQAAFEAAIAANPRDAVSHVNLGVLRMQSGDPAAAADEFATALVLDRSSAAARQGLDEARAALAAGR